MPISQLFILSPRGDKLAFKDFRQDVPRNSDEVFFRKYKFWDGKLNRAPLGDCPPFFTERGIHFSYVRCRQLLFVSTTRANDSPSCTVELLSRIISALKDFLGVLSEESVRKNFTLVYELWDEMLNLGIPQEISTEKLRPYIFHDVQQVALPEFAEQSLLDRMKNVDFSDRTKRSDAAAVSIVHSDGGKNEVYIDVLERMVATFDGIGNPVLVEVDGAIIVKSFLSGTPTLYLGLDENIAVGESVGAVRSRYASAVLDSVSFGETVDSRRFHSERVLVVQPPSGETTLLRYRSTAADHIKLPFRLQQSMQLLTEDKAEVIVKVRADIPGDVSAIGIRVNVPLPQCTVRASLETGVGGSDQSFDYHDRSKEMQWSIPRFSGGTEQMCKIRFSTSVPISAAVRRELGPLSMLFEIPQLSVTGLGLKSLRIEERDSDYNPSRWIRSMTQANSYVFRTH